MEISVKRIYDEQSKKDGFRILADRLWPRGISKTQANVDLWMKEMAPSQELRKWFHKDKEKNYTEFSNKYMKELKVNSEIIKKELQKHSSVTIVTAVKEIENSHIPTLLSFLNKLV